MAAGLHLGFDLLQDVGTGSILLFPFSRWHGELGLIGTERTLDLLPWLVPVTLLVGGWRWWRRREA